MSVEEHKERLGGVFPPIPTPFEGDEVALGKLTENLERWNATKIKGCVVLGSNGEFPYLTTDEKIRVIETVVASAKPAGKLVIAGVSSESTRETVSLAKKAASLGADYAIAVTPNYYKSKMTHGALVAHYSKLADESPIPVIVYSMPAYTGITVAPETIAELSKHPNIAGMKDSGGVIPLTGAYVGKSAPGFCVMAGSASFLFPGISVGCVGGVLALANVLPEQCCRLYELSAKGENEEARKLQLSFLEPNAAVTSKYGIAGLKYALEGEGYYGGPVRLPLLPVGEQEKKDIDRVFGKFG
ncbi:MAG: dihydrodipicolinate synthase family protein [Planctomycetota bacterium]|jgi:4-hydroxy-2-oxoglutarate aldolase